MTRGPEYRNFNFSQICTISTFSLLGQVIIPPLPAAGCTAEHKKMAAFTDRWTEVCMTPRYFGVLPGYDTALLGNQFPGFSETTL